MKKNLSLIRILTGFFILTLLIGCNPYKGFKGVDKKGMTGNKLPSEKLKDDYDKSSSRMKKSYKREMKRRKKRLGTSSDK